MVKARKSTSTELRCVLLGKAGQGKSSLGNLLTGKNAFEVGDGAQSETKEIKLSYSDVDNIRVIDTPGFAALDKTDVSLEISKVGITAYSDVIGSRLGIDKSTNDV